MSVESELLATVTAGVAAAAGVGAGGLVLGLEAVVLAVELPIAVNSA